MKVILATVLIAALASIAEWFAPWWSIAPVAAAVAIVLKLRPGKAFLAGLFGVGLLWLGVVLWRDIPNEHILSARLAKLFKLPNHTAFIAVTAILGGLIGGLSAWAGAQLALAFRRESPRAHAG